MSHPLPSRPTHAGAADLLARGLTFFHAAKFAAAQQCFERILQTAPQHPLALLHLGRTLLRLNVPLRAVPVLERAVAARPAAPETHFALGQACLAAGRADAAVASFRTATEKKPDWAEAWSHLGHAQGAAKNFDAALASLQRALTFPAYRAETFNHLGVVTAARGAPAQAVEYFLEAIQLSPRFFQAWSNLGNALRAQNLLDEALVAYRQSLALEPKNAYVKFNISIVQLMRGELSRDAWLKYEYRWVTLNYNPHRGFASQLWRGEPLAGKSILLYAEQGLGDTIQFIRYAADLARLGATVHVEVQKPLVAVLRDVPGVASIIGWGEPLPAFDFHCPLLSVPFAMDTRLDTIPAAPAYVRAPADRITAWKSKLAPTSRKRVGIVWRGNPRHANDANRSIALENFSRVFAAEGCEFVSLQVGPSAAESALLAEHRNVTDPTRDLVDFSETAALISQLDLVLAVDTSVCHLAGALGKPVWLLLPFSPDWRWLLDREDTPWYPAMRLFRQPAIGDWDSVLTRVVESLRNETAALHAAA